MQTNSLGDSHCYNCGKEGHWVSKCPNLPSEQQGQLHMAVKGKGGEEKVGGTQTGHKLLHVSMLQVDELPDNRAYLDECLTVTAFKSKKHLKNINTVKHGVKINCNSWVMNTNQQGNYGRMTAWYIPDGITNILSMNELEKKYRITYDSRDGYNHGHTPSKVVRFYKDKNELPYIDLDM